MAVTRTAMTRAAMTRWARHYCDVSMGAQLRRPENTQSCASHFPQAIDQPEADDEDHEADDHREQIDVSRLDFRVLLFLRPVRRLDHGNLRVA